MNGSIISYYRKKLTDYLAVKAEMVDHRGVIKDLVASVDRSWIYKSTLILASLIALLGLLTNSVAVVIGAMLISPLMGPIISSSLAFTIGDLPLARRAFKTIALSVALTIVVCAVVSFVSPLKEPTAEILTRVRPNIFDLFVAVLSGTAGAIALCTKRNYLVTTTGVAVATAVIPPLSVTGYGLGTGQPMLAMGGFLLFFTNFVAIVLTSNIVFFILGFRTSQVETLKYSRPARILIIAGLLSLISIPLVYTLVVDLRKVKEKRQIERSLKRYLNKELTSRMTGYDYHQDDKKVLITASVNTVRFFDKQAKQQIEKELSVVFNRSVDVRLEQVIVASEKTLKKPKEPELMPGASSYPLPRVETTAQIKSKVEQLVINVESELTAALAPFPVSDTRLSFTSSTESLHVSTTLKRDYPVGDDERLLLGRSLGRFLGLPVDLTVKTIPLLPPLVFDDAGSLNPATVAALEVIKQLPGESGAFSYVLESPRNSTKKQRDLKRYLVQNLGVPDSAVLTRSTRATAEPGSVTLRIVRR